MFQNFLFSCTCYLLAASAGGRERHRMAGAAPEAGAQVERMKRVRIFNPLHVLANKVSASDVEGLKILKLSQHPQIMLQIEVMEIEVIKYQTLAGSIKPLVDRRDTKGE
jgi:hypothetical protein